MRYLAFRLWEAQDLRCDRASADREQAWNLLPNHLWQSRAVPADDEKVATCPANPTNHDPRTPSPHRPLLRRIQPPPTPPITTPTGHPSHALQLDAQSAARTGRRHQHPQPNPTRHRRQNRIHHPATQQPTTPHRHRPNPRRNLRLPTHRSAQRPNPQTPKMKQPNLLPVGPAVADVLRHHIVGLTGFEPDSQHDVAGSSICGFRTSTCGNKHFYRLTVYATAGHIGTLMLHESCTGFGDGSR